MIPDGNRRIVGRRASDEHAVYLLRWNKKEEIRAILTRGAGATRARHLQYPMQYWPGELRFGIPQNITVDATGPATAAQTAGQPTT
jgi:hypothetical protein